MGFLHSFKALLAFVLLFTAALTAPMAMAAPMAASGHSMESMANCPSMPAKGDGAQHEEANAESCCAAPFLGFAVAPSGDSGLGPSAQAPSPSAVETFLGILSEIATPPPRFA